MTEFENNVLKELAEIKKLQQILVDIMSKSLDLAVSGGDDIYNPDFIGEIRSSNN